MRTVITGGAGFVGSHLCERFLARGHEVVCVDNLITGSLPNIELLRSNPLFSFIRHDISHPIEFGPGKRLFYRHGIGDRAAVSRNDMAFEGRRSFGHFATDPTIADDSNRSPRDFPVR